MFTRYGIKSRRRGFESVGGDHYRRASQTERSRSRECKHYGATAGYEHASENFTQFDDKFEKQEPALAFVEGNGAMAMGGAAAGVKFYAAYPMSPSTGVL